MNYTLCKPCKDRFNKKDNKCSSSLLVPVKSLVSFLMNRLFTCNAQQYLYQLNFKQAFQKFATLRPTVPTLMKCVIWFHHFWKTINLRKTMNPRKWQKTMMLVTVPPVMDYSRIGLMIKIRGSPFRL